MLNENQCSMSDACWPQALGGMLLALSSEGDIVYLTENVTQEFGLLQVHFYRLVPLFDEQGHEISLCLCLSVSGSASFLHYKIAHPQVYKIKINILANIVKCPL
jgi:hypothetical protein